MFLNSSRDSDDSGDMEEMRENISIMVGGWLGLNFAEIETAGGFSIFFYRVQIYYQRNLE